MKKDINKVDTSNMTDEEIDEYYRPQKSNNRKTLAPGSSTLPKKESGTIRKGDRMHHIRDIAGYIIRA